MSKNAHSADEAWESLTAGENDEKVILHDTKNLWEKLMAGEPEVDENVLITSSMINQQTADRIAALSNSEEPNKTQPEKELNMSDKKPITLKEFNSFEELKKEAQVASDLYDRFEDELLLPFMEYYAKYYRVMNGIPKPEEGIITKFDMVEVRSNSAKFVVHGYTRTVETPNPNYSPVINPNYVSEGPFLEEYVHERERFVIFPFEFLEDKERYLAEAESKKASDAKEIQSLQMKGIKIQLKQLRRQEKALRRKKKDLEESLGSSQNDGLAKQ